MSKQKIKAIIKNFLFINHPIKTKKVIREMYDTVMLSDTEISVKQRQDFTFVCSQIERLLSDINRIDKKERKKRSKNPILTS